MADHIPTDEAATRREHGLVGWDYHGPVFAAPEPEVVSRLLMAADGPPWWPRASRSQPAPVDGGSILDGYGPKGLWHSTETSAFPSYSTNYWPHLTVGLVDGRFQARQHIPFNRAARALRNESGGVQTNRTGVKQVEIIARAAVIGEIGLAPPLEDGLAEWATWLQAEWGVPLTCSVTFKTYPESYGADNGVRLDGPTWERYAGWLGHQHAPENEHGDPGALDWRRILQRGDWFDMATKEELAQVVDERIKAYFGRIIGEGQASYESTVENTLKVSQHTFNEAHAASVKADALSALLGGVASRVTAIEGDLDTLVEALAPPEPPPASNTQQVGS